MTKENKKILLKLAREAIRSGFEHKRLEIGETKISDSLRHKRATFVTLTIDGKLRGCIGHILPVQKIYKDVIENAQAAAFGDPRFLPLTQDEFKSTDIEISILGPCQKLSYRSSSELVQILQKDKPGVILKKGIYQATFLPQVWEEVPTAEEFLTHLCLKAGLNPDEWTKHIEVETYSVEKI